MKQVASFSRAKASLLFFCWPKESQEKKKRQPKRLNNGCVMRSSKAFGCPARFRAPIGKKVGRPVQRSAKKEGREPSLSAGGLVSPASVSQPARSVPPPCLCCFGSLRSSHSLDSGSGDPRPAKN